MLRRLKSDKSIISDLPDKIERDEYAMLTPDQTALYQQTLNEAMMEIEGIEGKDHASLFKREGLVLQMILALKQICNHPAQFLKTKQADAELRTASCCSSTSSAPLSTTEKRSWSSPNLKRWATFWQNA